MANSYFTYTMIIFMAIMPRPTFSKSLIESVCPAQTSWAAGTLATWSLFKGQILNDFTCVLGLKAPNLSFQGTFSLTFRFDPHYSIPRHKFIQLPLVFAHPVTLWWCLPAAQSLVLQHLAASWGQHSPTREMYFHTTVLISRWWTSL